ncbi:DNA-binding MarR family transcriptional regulator [Pseudarthrobacter sp. PvP004]|uniref:MarR family winged helix-turn-helix transcriptional regulator n=1 Tax=Pseudarthrobacter sp. PvP004 TaxID=2817850 RepID=UPI001AE8F449|nr:MarR family winged helix-turn-helix transcriptional regulator [Pseudarthrobacter sp. PvP004]MBP2266192.1 DNA-binding MarR family transcriptional regulator [Pseudarthrobacter sp. PvP004]
MVDNADATSLNPQELDVWAGVATLLERLPAALDAQLQRDSGLTNFEHGILFALYSAPDSSLRLSVLAGYASCTLSRLSRAISRLEAKGWVRREVDPADGRFTFGILTDAGRDKVVESTPAHHALIRHLVFESISAAQAQTLSSITRKISAAIGPDAGWRPPQETAAQQS